MQMRMEVDGETFTIAGSYGAVVVYDKRGSALAGPFEWVPQAEAWVRARAEPVEPVSDERRRRGY